MKKNIVCFGEVLWDVLPSGKLAGGAPMNVAIRLQSLGNNATVISKIGEDQNGIELIKIIRDAGVDISLIQQGAWPTGVVLVQLDANGNATYDIVYPSAWDKIELDDEQINAVKNSNAFVFGSLASRDALSKGTLESLLAVANWKVFDVNLRPPFYDTAAIVAIMKKSNLVKLNDDELTIITRSIGCNSDLLEEQVEFLADAVGLNFLCITKGKVGATVYKDQRFYHHPGYTVKVADTIGAGDSFLAALLDKFLSNNSIEDSLDYACAIGALVASKAGANPSISKEEIISIQKTLLK
jgi:fructokinase